MQRSQSRKIAKIPFALAITFIALIAIDGLLTFWATNNGYMELNPLVAPISDKLIFPALKVVFPLIGVAVVGFLVKKHPKLVGVANLGLIMMIGLYSVLLFSNLSEIL